MATIKELYNELKLKEMYEAYEEDSYKEIQGLIANVEGCLLYTSDAADE